MTTPTQSDAQRKEQIKKALRKPVRAIERTFDGIIIYK